MKLLGAFRYTFVEMTFLLFFLILSTKVFVKVKKYLLKQGNSFQHIRLAENFKINYMIIPSLDIGGNVNRSSLFRWQFGFYLPN